jgi:hypothetical protein
LRALAAWERAWRNKGGDERSRIEFLAWQIPHIVWIRELLLRLSQRKEGRVRGDGRLYKHPSSKFWWCAFYLRGKQIRQSTGETDEKQAKKFLKRKIREIENDKEGIKRFSYPQQERVTVNEILDDLVEYYKRGGEKGIPREVPPQMTSHLKPLREFFGTLRAMQVGSRDVEAFKSN